MKAGPRGSAAQIAAADPALRPPRWRGVIPALLWLGCAPIIAVQLALGHWGGGAGAGLVAGLVLILSLAGAVWPRSGCYARPIVAARSAARRVALTFDDGPDPATTPLVLEALAGAGHRATFFVVGAAAQRHTALLQQIVAAGHELGDHSLDHRWSQCFWSPRRIAADIGAVRDLLAAARLPAPRFYRPPVVLLSPRVARAAELAGVELVAYSTRAYDGRAGARPERCIARLVKGLRPGAILLLHDTRGAATIEIVGALLAAMERHQLRGVTLSELLATSSG